MHWPSKAQLEVTFRLVCIDILLDVGVSELFQTVNPIPSSNLTNDAEEDIFSYSDGLFFGSEYHHDMLAIYF